MSDRAELVLSFKHGDPDAQYILEALEGYGIDTSGLSIIKREGPDLAEYLRSEDAHVVPGDLRPDVQSVSEALQSLEQTCKLDSQCHLTAVTFVDGEPGCRYHSTDLRSDQV